MHTNAQKYKENRLNDVVMGLGPLVTNDAGLIIVPVIVRLYESYVTRIMCSFARNTGRLLDLKGPQ